MSGQLHSWVFGAIPIIRTLWLPSRLFPLFIIFFHPFFFTLVFWGIMSVAWLSGFSAYIFLSKRDAFHVDVDPKSSYPKFPNRASHDIRIIRAWYIFSIHHLHMQMPSKTKESVQNSEINYFCWLQLCSLLCFKQTKIAN